VVLADPLTVQTATNSIYMLIRCHMKSLWTMAKWIYSFPITYV